MRAAPAGGGELVVDLESPVPAFEQIRAAVTALVATGELATGVRLPSVRQLAADLGIAPGTVQHAYSELRTAGVVSTATRRGVVVTGAPYLESGPPARSRDGLAPDGLSLAAAGFIAQARRLGATDDAIQRAVETALAR